MTVQYQTAIENYANQQLGVGDGHILAFDNVPFIVPDESWIKVEIFDGVVGRASLGPRHLERSVGSAFFTIYSPKSVGSYEARSIADDIIAAFRAKQITTVDGVVTFFDATVKRLGEVYAPAAGSTIGSTASIQWYVIAVGIGFQFDEVV
jgi:hypothetical protein